MVKHKNKRLWRIVAITIWWQMSRKKMANVYPFSEKKTFSLNSFCGKLIEKQILTNFAPENFNFEVLISLIQLLGYSHSIKIKLIIPIILLLWMVVRNYITQEHHWVKSFNNSVNERISDIWQTSNRYYLSNIQLNFNLLYLLYYYYKWLFHYYLFKEKSIKDKLWGWCSTQVIILSHQICFMNLLIINILI